MSEQQMAPRKKKLSTVQIVLIVFGVLAFGTCGTCALCVGIVGKAANDAAKEVASVPRPTFTAPSIPEPAPAHVAEPSNVVAVAIRDVLSAYHDNELRGDALYKDKWVELTGSVGDVKKDIMDSAYVTIGTGKMFEIPMVQCFLKDGELNKAMAYRKGSRIKVRGHVEGLMMNVLVHDCEIVR